MTWDLIADIGGTNARIAALEGGEIRRQVTHDSKADLPVVDAIADFVAASGVRPWRAAVAVAGPIIDGKVRLTNATNQDISVTALEAATGIAEICFLNDFEAAAWALATIDPADIDVVRGSPLPPEGNRLVIGPGTGLGVGFLVADRDRRIAIRGEGGHVGLSPVDREEAEIFEAFGREWPETRMGAGLWRFEAEAMLSGTGLPCLYRAVAEVAGIAPSLSSGGEILAAARTGEDKVAVRTARIFASHLARVAGDHAFTATTTGGVFLTGGVALGNPWLFDAGFARDFDAGGRFDAARSRFPIYLYTNPKFGLLGAANALLFGTQR